MRPFVFVIVSAICFGTTGTAQAYGPDAASSSAVGLTRIVAGGALLGIFAWWVAGRSGVRTLTKPTRSQCLVVLVGGGAVLAYQPAFFEGARLNGVAIAAAVMLGAAPVLTGLLEWIVTREVPPRVWFIATACSVAGVILISGLLETSGESISIPGLAGSLGAGAAYAVYAVATKRLLSDAWSPTAAIGSIFATAAVLGAPFLLLVDLSWVVEPSGLAMVGWLAVVTVALAYVLFAIGLQSLSAATTSTLTLAEPLTACVLGLVLLDERLTGMGWLGLMILSGGVLVLAIGGASRRRVEVRS